MADDKEMAYREIVGMARAYVAKGWSPRANGGLCYLGDGSGRWNMAEACLMAFAEKFDYFFPRIAFETKFLGERYSIQRCWELLGFVDMEDMMRWNDADGRTREEVVARFDAAIGGWA